MTRAQMMMAFRANDIADDDFRRTMLPRALEGAVARHPELRGGMLAQVRYGAYLVMHDPEQVAPLTRPDIWALLRPPGHTEETLAELLAQMRATPVDGLGVWAVMVLAEVLK